MARLHECQGKAILAANGFEIYSALLWRGGVRVAAYCGASAGGCPVGTASGSLVPKSFSHLR